MTRSIKSAWLPLSLAAAAMLALVGWLAVAGLAQAGVSSLSVESKTAAPGENVTVALNAAATSPGIGSYEIKVEYNDAVLDVVSCAKTTSPDFDAAVCSIDFVVGNGTTGTAIFIGASNAGASGSVSMGTLTLKCATAGTAHLTISIQKLTDPSIAPISVVPTNGVITCAVPATPSPSPSPTAAPTASPTAAPTASPAALPKTGGSPSDGTSLTPWLLPVQGLVVVSGGAWAVAPTRR